jgi:hypothetical protein
MIKPQKCVKQQQKQKEQHGKDLRGGEEEEE